MRVLPIIIAGAGPAGCSAARTLAESGYPTVLVERGSVAKHKVCGDAYLPDAIAEMALFGIKENDLHTISGVPFDHIDLVANDRRIWQVPLTSGRGWVIQRAAADQLLRDELATTCEIRYNTGVIGITKASDGTLSVAVREVFSSRVQSVRCSAVILATGSGSPLPRRFGIDGVPRTALSLTTYATAPSQRTTAPIFEFGKSWRPGYAWAFPAATGLNVGVCALTARPGSGLRRAADEFARQHELNPIQWRGGAGAMWSGRGQRWHDSDGIVSCGDAAGVVDPFTGEGISAALKTGREAGAAVTRYLAAHNNEELAAFSRWVRRHYLHVFRHSPTRRIWSHLCGIPIH